MATSSEERISVSMLVTQCEDTFKTHLDVEKVCSTMLTSEKTGGNILSKTTTKHLKKFTRKGTVNQFLGVIKKLELSEFVLFLESLERIGDPKHLTALTTVATHIPYLSLPDKSPIDTLMAEKLSQIHEVHFKTTRHLDVEDPVQSQISHEMESLNVSLTGPADLHQPLVMANTTLSIQEEIKTQNMSDTERSLNCAPNTKVLQTSIDEHSVTITVGRGGACLYSSVHGVTVTVPANAVPSHIKEFKVHMSASLRHVAVPSHIEDSASLGHVPFEVKYIPCSAVVSLTTEPVIDKFSRSVKVSIPHCAMRVTDHPELYCLLSKSDDNSSFEEDPDVDCSYQSRYLSFTTKHFTKYLGARKRKQKSTVPLRKLPDRLSKMKAKSLEHEPTPLEVTSVQSELQRSVSNPFPRSEYSPDTRFCLGMFTPRFKDGSVWKLVFLTCLDVQTGYAEMEQDAIKLLGVEGFQSLDPLSQRIPFTFKKDCSSIVFSPDRSSCNGWRVNALRIPAIISQRDVLYHIANPREDTSYAPHCLPYAVKRESDATTTLFQEFTIKGVQSCYGDQIEQNDVSVALVAELTSPRQAMSVGLFFGIIEDLYTPASIFLKAVQGQISPEKVHLNVGEPETIIILAELSFCIFSEWPLVAKYLTLQSYDIEILEASYTSQKQEASFQMMMKWLRSSEMPHTNLQFLLDVLKKIGVVVHVQKLAQDAHSLNQKHFHDLPRNIVSDLAIRIASQWKCVGRLLGMTETDINLAASQGSIGINDYHKIVEQTITMLDLWRQRYGRDATLLKLRNVIFAIHEHSNHNLWDAIDFISNI